MPVLESAKYYRQPTPDDPIKTGDVFAGGALIAPGNPILSLQRGLELRSPTGVLTSYNGPVLAHSAPGPTVAEDLGPVVDQPLVGHGYFILLSYTCDYSEPAKDHALRLIAPLWDLFCPAKHERTTRIRLEPPGPMPGYLLSHAAS